MAGRGQSLEPGEESRRDGRRLRAPRELGPFFGQGSLARCEVGGGLSHPLGFVLPALLGRLGLPLQLGERGRALFEGCLGLGDGVLTRFERPDRFVRGLLFLLDVGLEASQRSLDLLECLCPFVELGVARGDTLLDAFDRGRALLDVTLAGRESRREVVGVGRRR